MADRQPPSGTDRDRRVHALFEAVLDLEASARAAYLHEACADQPDLQVEVEQLLRAAERARTADVLPALWSPSPVSAAPWPADATPDTPAAPTLVPGDLIHDHHILERVGEGAMGVSFLARHRRLGHVATVTVLHQHLGSDPVRVQQFLGDARAASALRHRHIVEVIDAGLLPRSGAPYLIMGYQGGEDLANRLKRVGRLPLDQALQITGQAAAALAAAHDAGMVHRDLRPEHLLLLPGPDGAEAVQVLGFGLAGLRPDVASALKHHPATVVATLRYLSPEQCRGVRDVDQRADVYSLAIILHEMLCGRPPFISEGAGELMAMQLMRDPPRLRSLDGAIPAPIEEAVLRALAKAPRERFATMPAFCAALGPAAVPPTPEPARDSRRDARQVAIVEPAPSPATAAPAANRWAARPRARRRLVLASALALVAAAAVTAGLILSRGG
jgi:eukaryotic-like serine/threonine-protein kinase